MGLSTLDPAILALACSRELGFVDVVAELRDACRRRTTPAERLDQPGMFGVLSGAGPVAWAHGQVDGKRLRSVLASAPDLKEIYIATTRVDVATAVMQDGWRLHADVGHFLFAGGQVEPTAALASYPISEATPSDMPAIREMLIRSFPIPPEVIAEGYPDDFFIKAAPSRLSIARDRAGDVVGSIGTRTQGSGVMLFGLAVDPAHRRRGVARALTQTAMASSAEDAAFLHAITNEITGALAESVSAREVGRWLHLLRGPALS